ncbi:hypothetical protein I4F81_003292 [Pyropia yezoensis]|uniref:Uncharacterized protein n=1 Tax=Pyropia yezoensis TaxID=2788 RepID=A0ACC3BRS5_PYRYE|nr:hypothetical protein I4F81_003292 [Neopyropia yezoensis]
MALVSDSSKRSGSSGGGGSVRGSRRARPGVTTVALAVTVVASAAAACWKVAGSLQRLCPTPGGSVHHTTSADPAAYEVFVFEPNRVFSPQYEALRARGLDFTLIPVPALDFSAWLSRTFAPDDYLLCKIDVEGSETAVLRKMLLDGTLCACNRLSVEWHMWLGVPGNPHAIGMNSPAALANDTAGGRVVGADGGGTAYTCTIPHARRQLPYAECVLPKMVEWVRRACPASAPLEKWF